MDLLVREHFGLLSPDPWEDLDLPTADAARVAKLVRAAVQARAFVSVLGPRGSGKTHAVRAALHETEAQIIEPWRLDRERLHLGDLQVALVRELSDETPRRSGEARSGQVRRLLDAAAEERALVLLIDDSHCLHSQTLRGLKRLRELGAWRRGKKKVRLGIVLVAQTDRTERIAEVGLRSGRMWLAGLSRAEASSALDRVLNQRIEPAARKALARSPRARGWLDLQALADECLTEALARAEPTITAEAAAAVLRGTAAGRRTPALAPEPEPSPGASDAAVAGHLAQKLGTSRGDRRRPDGPDLRAADHAGAGARDPRGAIRARHRRRHLPRAAGACVRGAHLQGPDPSPGERAVAGPGPAARAAPREPSRAGPSRRTIALEAGRYPLSASGRRVSQVCPRRRSGG